MSFLLFLAITIAVLLWVHPWQVAALVLALAGLAVLLLEPTQNRNNPDR